MRGHVPGEPASEEMVEGVCVISRLIANLYWPFDGVARSAVAKSVWHIRDDFDYWNGIGQVMPYVRPDVVHTNNLTGLGTRIWKIAASSRWPVIHTLHDYQLFCPRTLRFRNGNLCTMSCMDCRMLTISRRRATRFVKAVVGVSRATLDVHVREGLSQTPPNAWLSRTSRRSAELRLLVPGKDLVFGFIGRVTEEKGRFTWPRRFPRCPIIAGWSSPARSSPKCASGWSIWRTDVPSSLVSRSRRRLTTRWMSSFRPYGRSRRVLSCWSAGKGKAARLLLAWRTPDALGDHQRFSIRAIPRRSNPF